MTDPAIPTEEGAAPDSTGMDDARPGTRPARGGQGLDEQWIKTLLTRLAVAISRRRTYSASHPMAVQSELALANELLPKLAQVRTLVLGVSDRELMVNGALSEKAGPIARDLAERLRRRGIGAITFQQGATVEGLRSLLDWIMQAPGPGESEPLDNPGVGIKRLAYDMLVMADPEAVQREVNSVWRELVHAAVSGRRSAGHPEGGLSAGFVEGEISLEELGRSIEAVATRPEEATRIAAVLESVAMRVMHSSPAVRESLSQKLRDLFAQLGPAPIQALVKALGNGHDQKRFLSTMCDALPVEVIVGWLQVASQAIGQDLSQHLLGILTKLSTYAEEAAKSSNSAVAEEARQVVRDAAQDLVQAWDLDDPNPDDHRALLDQIASLDATGWLSSESAMASEELAGVTTEAARLVQMACEIDVPSVDAIAAVETLVANGETMALMSWLRAAPGNKAAARLRDELLAPQAVRVTLLADPCDAEAAEALLSQLGSDQVPMLLDILQVATSSTARRLTYRRLRDEGPALYGELAHRLHEPGEWYVIRNLLSLLRDVGGRQRSADGSPTLPDLNSFQSHSQPRVRLEALRLLARNSRTIEPAIARALGDDDPDVVTAAVEATHSLVSGNMPRRSTEAADEDHLYGDSVSVQGQKTFTTAGTTDLILSRGIAVGLMRSVDAGKVEENTAVLAIGCLRHAKGPTVCSWLIQRASVRTSFLHRLRLAPLRPRVLAALSLLREQYSDDSTASRLIALADRHSLSRSALQFAGTHRDTLDDTWPEGGS